MKIPEAARRLGVADADLREVKRHAHGTEIIAWSGAHWLLHDDGRLFALDDHPGTKNLQRWDESNSEQRAVTFDDKPAKPEQEPAERDQPQEPATREQPQEPAERDGPQEPGVRDLGVDIPDGNIGEIMDWVGQDKERAQRAIDKENERQTPRRGLINHLNKVKDA